MGIGKRNQSVQEQEALYFCGVGLEFCMEGTPVISSAFLLVLYTTSHLWLPIPTKLVCKKLSSCDTTRILEWLFSTSRFPVNFSSALPPSIFLKQRCHHVIPDEEVLQT
jgi:hypothetical protein